MDEIELIREWYAYNNAVREKYTAALKELSDEQLNRDMGASFHSIIRIYCHVVDAYNWWFGPVMGRRGVDSETAPPLTGRHIWHEGMKMDEAEEEAKKMQALVGGVLGSLEDSDMGERIRFRRRRGDGFEEENLRIRTIIWHMVEEELQHRGELNALMWQIDAEPPVTGWDPTE